MISLHTMINHVGAIGVKGGEIEATRPCCSENFVHPDDILPLIS